MLSFSSHPDVVIPESPEAYIKLTENTLKSSSGMKRLELVEHVVIIFYFLTLTLSCHSHWMLHCLIEPFIAAWKDDNIKNSVIYFIANNISVDKLLLSSCYRCTNAWPSFYINGMQTEALGKNSLLYSPKTVCWVCGPGEPGQLEASLRQLDQALDVGRYHLQQREAAAANRSSPDIDSTYMGYVRFLSTDHFFLL